MGLGVLLFIMTIIINIIGIIAGGMHFRTSMVDGEALGTSVAEWVASHAFQKR